MPSAQEKKALARIGEAIGEELKETEELHPLVTGFTLDPQGRVVGLSIHQKDFTDLSRLGGLPLLQALFLHDNSVTDIQSIEKLTNLQKLGLAENSISDIRPLGKLTRLQELYLSYNSPDIQPIEKLTNLRTLDLSYNSLTDIQPLGKLTNLRTLDLSYNYLTDIQPLGKLTDLQQLSLAFNQVANVAPLEHLVAPRGRLKNAELWANQIRSLPASWLDGRTKLNLSNMYHPSEPGVFLLLNPLEYPPIEVLQQGKEAVASYARSLVGERRPLNEVRVLLVGEGEAGKTTLVKRLLGEKRDPKEDPTEGIQIRSWDVALTNDEKVTAHLWDFGGQEILHATHRFFLSTRSLYLVVLDGRRDERPEYWLEHVKTYGGNSPVLVVLNKQDQNPGHDVERASLQRKYPNIVGFFPTSCETDEGLDNVLQALLEEIDGLHMRKSPFAENWLRVKEALADMDEDYLSVEAYRAICREEEITDEVPQNTLLRFLDQLGIVLYFDEFELADTHVLKPEWLTQGVYRLLNSKTVARQDGALRLAQIPDLLKKHEPTDFDYPPGKQQFLVGMMKKFELCYTLDDERLLIPDQLPLQEPEELPFDPDSAPSYYVQYGFLPPSIFVRFLVKHHKDIRQQWRTGVLLEDPELSARALVREDKAEKRISIWIDGEQRRDYLSTLRKTLRDLHGDFEGLEAKEWIPLPDSLEHAVEYDELVGLEQMGKGEYVHGKTRKTYRVAELLNSVERPEEREERFEKQERGGVYVHVESKPEIHTSAHARAAAQATASVEVKNEIHEFGSTLQVLREDLLDELEGKERKKLGSELDRVRRALEQIEGETSPEEAKTSTAMKRLSKFIEKLGDTSTRVGKAIQAVEDGVGYARELAGHYNKIAQWCGLPTVPRPLVGGSED